MADKNGLLLAGIAAFAFALVIGPFIIRFLYRLKFGQSVRTDGPKTHQRKSGTPTMGGVIIIIAFVAASLIAAPKFDLLLRALFAAVGFGLVGLMDDFIIVVSKKPVGLRARYKLLGQTVVALIVALYALQAPELGPSIWLPFIGELVSLPDWFFLLLATTTLVGFANGVNFADGLDGLAAGATAVSAAVYAVIAFSLGSMEMAVFAAAVAGACLGFAWFNSHPAQVFMGDTGSLALGGALGALAVLTRTELLLVIIGGLFVIETLSVVLQVVYFKLTGGRRIFRMSPLHHHYELSGWAETKVVTRFWLVALVFGLLGLLAANSIVM